MGLGLVVVVWLARYLGPEQFGIFSFAVSFIGLFSVIAGLGLHEVVVRDIVRDQAGRGETLGTAAFLQLIGGAIAYSFAIGLIHFLRPNDHLAQAMVGILGFTMLFRASDVVAFYFEAEVASKYTVWVQTGTFIAFATVKGALILSNASLIAFAWAALMEGLCVAVLMALMLKLRGTTVEQLRATRARAGELLAHSWPLLLSGIAIILYMKVDQIMLAQLVGDEAVGIYSVAVRFSEVVYFVSVAIIASVFPAIIRTKDHSISLYYERLQKLFDIMVWLSLCAAIPMTFMSTAVVAFLFGDVFAPAGAVLSIHIWAAVFVFLGVVSNKWLVAENRGGLVFHRSLLGMTTNILLNLLLIPAYGPIGAAIATVVSQAAAVLLADLIQKETRNLFRMKISSMNPVASLRRLLAN